MKVEVLYVAECPSHPAAVKLIKDVLFAEGIVADIREILVSDERTASELKFPGSPTIRINGRDVAPVSYDRQGFALNCRLYRGSKHVGLPPTDLIQKAVMAAHEGERL